jgi:hypothetical protein
MKGGGKAQNLRLDGTARFVPEAQIGLGVIRHGVLLAGVRGTFAPPIGFLFCGTAGPLPAIGGLRPRHPIEEKTMEETPSMKLVEEYLRLGGRRKAVIDDNFISTRAWEEDPPQAEAFWKDRIEPLDADRRKEVESLLPTINAR